MANSYGLFRRKNSSKYTVKVTVPADLLAIVGGSPQIWRSTGTSDLAEAKRRARAIQDEYDARWTSLRSGRTIEQADAEHLVWSRYQKQLSADDARRQQIPNSDDLEDIYAHLVKRANGDKDDIDAFRIVEQIEQQMAEDQQARHDRLARLKKALANNNARALYGELDDALISLGITPVKNKSAYRNTAMSMLRADVEALQRTIERDGGDFSGKPADPIVRQPTASRQAAAQAKAKGQTIMDLWTKFKEQNKSKIGEGTWNDKDAIIRTLISFAGENALASDITHELMRDWKDGLYRYPVKAMSIRAFDGMSFNEVIAANAKIGKPTISERTVGKYLYALAPFMLWLRTSQRLISEDVLEGHTIAFDKGNKTVFPYSMQQLDKLFASPLFHQCGGTKKEHLIGAVEIRDWRFWLPLIAIFSGARLGELTQLRVSDIRESSGIWFFSLATDDEEGFDPLVPKKKLKTNSSSRVVPIHRNLIKLGLLEYRSRQTGAQLFPEMKPDKGGSWSVEASSFFSKYLTEVGVRTDRSQNFHSFRHGMADALRRAGWLDEQTGMLLGHVKAGTTKSYGVIPEGPLRMRSEIIESITYDVPALNALIARDQVVAVSDQ